MKNKRKTIICDDYMDASYITEVKKAVDDFVRKNNLKFQVIKKFVNRQFIFDLEHYFSYFFTSIFDKGRINLLEACCSIICADHPVIRDITNIGV